MSEPEPIEKLSYEAAFQELQSIVAALESGDQTLEEALALYERGQALVRHCSTLLEQAELKVQVLQGAQLTDFGNAIRPNLE